MLGTYPPAATPSITGGARVEVRRNALIGGSGIPANTWQPVPFNVEVNDPLNYHDPATNTSRLTVPAGQAGAYLIWGSVVWGSVGASPNNWRIVSFGRNGSAVDRLIEEYNYNLPNGATPGMAPTTVAELAVGDYVELLMYSPAATDIYYAASPVVQPRFGMVRIG